MLRANLTKRSGAMWRWWAMAYNIFTVKLHVRDFSGGNSASRCAISSCSFMYIYTRTLHPFVMWYYMIDHEEKKRCWWKQNNINIKTAQNKQKRAHLFVHAEESTSFCWCCSTSCTDLHGRHFGTPTRTGHCAFGNSFVQRGTGDCCKIEENRTTIWTCTFNALKPFESDLDFFGSRMSVWVKVVFSRRVWDCVVNWLGEYANLNRWNTWSVHITRALNVRGFALHHT